MHIAAMIENINQLTAIHQQLYEQSMKKTEAIKSNEMERLQKLIISEQKLVRQLKKTEAERIKNAAFFASQLENDDPVISDILQTIQNDKEKQELEQAVLSLSESVLLLREQEQLNQELIHQSLKFVNMSLEMLSPSLTSMNYGKQQHSPAKNKSMFDSKA